MNCRIFFPFVSVLLVGALKSGDALLRSTDVPLGTNPGAAIRLHKSAIESMLDRSTYFFSKYVNYLPIPDLKATISGIQFETNSTKIVQFDQPRLSLRLSPPDALEASFELPRVTVETNFTADRSVGFGRTQHDGGKLMFTANEVKSTFELRFGQFDTNGLPKIESFQCSSSLGPSKMKVIGAKERYPIEVLNLAAKGVRPIYETQLCALARAAVSDHLNWVLAKLPDVLPVNQRLAVKYQIQPVVGQDYLQVNLYEKVITDTASSHSPAPFVETPGDEAMIAAFLSDAMINDALYQAYANQLLGFTVDKDSPRLLYELIRLRCSSSDSVACLGNQMPDLVEKYGQDADVQFHFETTKAPELEFAQDKATLRASVAAQLDVSPANGGEKKRELAADLDLVGSLRVKIHDQRIYGKLSVDRVDVNLKRDGDTKEQTEKDAAKISETIKRLVEEHVNGDLLLKGFPLSLPFGLAFVQPLVKFEKHTLQVHTGFEYTGFGFGFGGYGAGAGENSDNQHQQSPQPEEEQTPAAEPEPEPEPEAADADSADMQQK